jgi:hypothetical protein
MKTSNELTQPGGLLESLLGLVGTKLYQKFESNKFGGFSFSSFRFVCGLRLVIELRLDPHAAVFHVLHSLFDLYD